MMILSRPSGFPSAGQAVAFFVRTSGYELQMLFDALASSQPSHQKIDAYRLPSAAIGLPTAMQSRPPNKL